MIIEVCVLSNIRMQPMYPSYMKCLFWSESTSQGPLLGLCYGYKSIGSHAMSIIEFHHVKLQKHTEHLWDAASLLENDFLSLSLSFGQLFDGIHES